MPNRHSIDDVRERVEGQGFTEIKNELGELDRRERKRGILR